MNCFKMFHTEQKKVCRSVKKVAKENRRKYLLNAIADICRWNFCIFLQPAYIRRKILKFFACQQQISAIAVSKRFSLFFTVLCFLYMQQTFYPEYAVSWLQILYENVFVILLRHRFRFSTVSDLYLDLWLTDFAGICYMGVFVAAVCQRW